MRSISSCDYCLKSLYGERKKSREEKGTPWNLDSGFMSSDETKTNQHPCRGSLFDSSQDAKYGSKTEKSLTLKMKGSQQEKTGESGGVGEYASE